MPSLFHSKQETSKKSDKKYISLKISSNSFRQRKESGSLVRWLESLASELAAEKVSGMVCAKLATISVA